MHLRVEGHGRPLTVLLTPGQQHESTVFERLMEQGAIKRAGRGRPRLRPHRVVGDKGYSARRIRNYLHRRGIRHTIPRRRDECRRGPFDRAIYRKRNVVERTIGRLKEFRHLATRFDKRGDSYRAMWIIGFIIVWIRFADTA